MAALRAAITFFDLGLSAKRFKKIDFTNLD
jgi:hypothetical protein